MVSPYHWRWQMRRYGLVDVKERREVEFKCDICGLDFMQDELEAQECFSLWQEGGYSSVFGDGAEVYVDICQHCFKKTLGDYCTVL
jgi:hypothetical protein